MSNAFGNVCIRLRGKAGLQSGMTKLVDPTDLTQDAAVVCVVEEAHELQGKTPSQGQPETGEGEDSPGAGQADGKSDGQPEDDPGGHGLFEVRGPGEYLTSDRDSGQTVRDAARPAQQEAAEQCTGHSRGKG